MRNIVIYALTALFITSCSIPTNKSTETDKVEKKTLENQEQEYDGSTIWVGEITEENFQKEPYKDWYDFNYTDYTVDQSIVNQFKKELRDYDITVFMGTWCSDSQAVTPELFKILEAANYPDSKVSMYAVDRSKKSLNGEEDGKAISYVPTIIFYKNGKEVNRIVESPINTLEEDMRDIVLGNPYTPNYSE